MADTLRRLRDVLKDERRALLAADYASLGQLSERKLRLLTLLARERRAEADLARLGEELGRNHALVSAALDGVREAVTRRDAIHSARDGLSTYAPDGAKATNPGRPSFERKA